MMKSGLTDKIAVIVPCYNVENYLARCLDSLLSQTYDNLEVIMVEDYSTDKTKDVVMRYEKKYKNFRAIYNKENGGLGNARNVGISAADSDYIAFLDSDDWLPDNFLSEMHGVLVKNKADISICDIYLRYDDPTKDQRVVSYNPKPDKYGIINTGMAASSSNKLFKKKLFEGLRYPLGIVNEDIPVTLALMSQHKVVYAPDTHFNYYQRTGSIQNSQITERRLEVFRAVSLLRENVPVKIDKKTWEAVIWHQLFAVLMFVFPRANGLIYRKNLTRAFYNTANNNNIVINENNSAFREFSKNSRAYRFYGSKLIRLVNDKHFLTASTLMSMYSFVSRHKNIVAFGVKLMKFLRFMILHPISFTRVYGGRLKHRLLRKKVIDTDLKMEDLVVVAKKQQQLAGEGKVSVIIPNYNYERFLIQRVYSILAQTEKIGEIIILDDCSSDGSVKLAEAIKSKLGKYVSIKTINNKKNAGTFRQWERGFSKSLFDLVWIAEADDYCDSNFLRNALEPMQNNSKVVISYVNTGYTDSKGILLGNVVNDIDYQRSGHWNKSYINNGLKEAQQYTYLNNTIANVSSVLFRKIPKLNFKEFFATAREYRQAGDWIFYVNYMLQGDIAYTNKVLNYYRIHGNNVSSTTKAQDHLAEIIDIQKIFETKLSLNKDQKEKIAQRIKLLRKAWSL